MKPAPEIFAQFAALVPILEQQLTQEGAPEYVILSLKNFASSIELWKEDTDG